MGAWYYGGLAAAALFCAYQAYLIKERDVVQSFRAFLNNAWFGGAVFAGILLDYTFRRLSRARGVRATANATQRAAPAALSSAASALTVAPVVTTSSTIAIDRPREIALDAERPRHAGAPLARALPRLRRRRRAPRDAALERRHASVAASVRAISCAWL